MAVNIVEVATPRQLKQFIKFPLKLYRNNPYYIPPLNFDERNTLDPRRNPACEFCDTRYWLAYKNGKLAGRIAGIYNKRFVEICGKKYLRFGWVDFIDDEEVVVALFKALESWGKELGVEAIHGPLGFTDLDREGMLIEGFQEIGTMATIYNYPYYPKYLEQLGYQKDIDWVEYDITVPKVMPQKLVNVSQIVKQRLGLHTLQIKKIKDVLPYAHQIFEVINATYAVLYGFVPLTEKQIDTYVKQYISLMNPDFIAIVLDKNNQIVGIGLTMPSLARALQKARGKLFPFGFVHLLWALKHAKVADLLIVGVLPEYQGQGVPALMIAEIGMKLIRKGIQRAESNPELETNVKVQSQWKYFDLRQHKRRRCYIKHV